MSSLISGGGLEEASQKFFPKCYFSPKVTLKPKSTHRLEEEGGRVQEPTVGTSTRRPSGEEEEPVQEPELVCLALGRTEVQGRVVKGETKELNRGRVRLHNTPSMILTFNC